MCIAVDADVGAVVRLAVIQIQVIGLAVPHFGADPVVAVPCILHHPAIGTAAALLHIGSVCSSTSCHLQEQTTAHIPELIDVGCVHHSA